MEKDKIFFGKDGLTSTSANHVANMAKEYIVDIESELSSIGFYSTSVALIGSDSSNSVIIGNTTEDMNRIPNLLKQVAEAKSLIAWLREAIIAKDNLDHELAFLGQAMYTQETGQKEPVHPSKDAALTEDQYYASLSIKERNRYYQLETEAAVLGKYIHPTGAFSKARKHLAKVIRNPHNVEGSGRDTIIYEHTPSVLISDVDDMFFSLQSKYREVQAQLNQMKHACEQAIKASEREVEAKYLKELDAWTNQKCKFTDQVASYIKNKQVEIASYKIIIPDSLRGIYETVSKLGK